LRSLCTSPVRSIRRVQGTALWKRSERINPHNVYRLQCENRRFLCSQIGLPARCSRIQLHIFEQPCCGSNPRPARIPRAGSREAPAESGSVLARNLVRMVSIRFLYLEKKFAGTLSRWNEPKSRRSQDVWQNASMISPRESASTRCPHQKEKVLDRSSEKPQGARSGRSTVFYASDQPTANARRPKSGLVRRFSSTTITSKSETSSVATQEGKPDGRFALNTGMITDRTGVDSGMAEMTPSNRHTIGRGDGRPNSFFACR